LKKLVRALFVGPFTVVDYSAIEARVVAWLAREEWALQAFRDHRDIYVETAARMSTPGNELTRFQGKVAVLALGYNGGINSLRAMGAEGDDEDLKRLVVQWRKSNSRITRLWQKLGDAFSDTGEAGPHLRLTESEDKLGRALHMWLPSGRAITYHGVKWERYVVVDPKTGKMVHKEGWRYADPKNPFNYRQRIGTYGGRLTENATQAVARDIMAEALVRLEDKGFRPVAHVHDEIIVEGEHDVEEIKAIMTEVPSWAEGLPIDGEGFTCARYRKG
jgi:DNA polymerase